MTSEFYLFFLCGKSDKGHLLLYYYFRYVAVLLYM